VRRAPTEYGLLSYHITSQSDRGLIVAEVEMPAKRHPSQVVLRLRHPAHDPMRSVIINGKPWTDFDAAKEWITMPFPGEERYSVEAHYR
jgi:hypothetical protein